MDVLAISRAAERIGCSRTTLYRAIEDGRLNAVDTGAAKVIVLDEKWDAFQPKQKGFRVTGSFNRHDN